MMAVPSSVTSMVEGLGPVTAMHVIGQIAMIAGKDTVRLVFCRRGRIFAAKLAKKFLLRLRWSVLDRRTPYGREAGTEGGANKYARIANALRHQLPCCTRCRACAES